MDGDYTGAPGASFTGEIRSCCGDWLTAAASTIDAPARTCVCRPSASHTHPTTLCPFRSAPFSPFLSVDDQSSVPAYPSVHPSARRRPSHRHRLTNDRPALQAASFVDVEHCCGAAPGAGLAGVHDMKPRAARQIVILRYCCIYSLIYLIVRRRRFLAF